MTAKYRKQFDINPDDLEIIESALIERARVLCLEMLEKQATAANERGAGCADELNTEMTEIQMLLGKLHNQKIWYSPQQYVPRG
jgi:hypothetical protein